MIKTVIIGATGYTGRELVSIISAHKELEIVGLAATKTFAGENYSKIYPKFKGIVDIPVTTYEKISPDNADVFFFALPNKISHTCTHRC